MIDHGHSSKQLQELAARSGAYRLFGRLWLCEVDVELMAKLCESPLSDAATQAGLTLPTTDPQSALATLAVDYCQLFVGPREHLPPIQSVWQSSQFQSPSAASMQEVMRILPYTCPEYVSKSGFDEGGPALCDAKPQHTASLQFGCVESQPPSHLPGARRTTVVMPDHLGLQLDVMGHLLEQAARCDENSAKSPDWLGLAKTFFERHLTWPNPLFRAAKQRARSEFYQSVIQATQDFLLTEHDLRNGWSETIA